MRETIGIEALLQLAYRTWQVDRVGRSLARSLLNGPSGIGTSSVASLLALGTRVDTSSAAAVMLGRAAEAKRRVTAMPEDLWAVDRAVMALDDFWVEQAGAAVAVWDRETAAAMGQAIIEDRAPGNGKSGTLWWVEPAGRPDRRRPLHRVVTTVLVIQHARAADRPEVRSPKLISRRPVCVPGTRRLARVEETWDPTPAQAAYDRAVHGIWAVALDMLAARLGGLERYAVTPLERVGVLSASEGGAG